MYERNCFKRELFDLGIGKNYEHPSYEKYSDARIDTIYITLTPNEMKRVDEAFEKERNQLKYVSRPRFSYSLTYWRKLYSWMMMVANKQRRLRIQIVKKLLKNGTIAEPAAPTDDTIKIIVNSLKDDITRDFQDQINALIVFTNYMKNIPDKKMVVPSVSSFLDVLVNRTKNNLVEVSTSILKKLVESVPYVGKVAVYAFERYNDAKETYEKEKKKQDDEINAARATKDVRNLRIFLDRETNRLTTFRESVLDGIEQTQNEYLVKFRGAKTHGNKKQVIEYEIMSAITQWVQAIKLNIRDIKYYKTLFSAIWIMESRVPHDYDTGDIKIEFAMDHGSAEDRVVDVSVQVRATFSSDIQELLASNLGINGVLYLGKIYNLPVRKTLYFFYQPHGKTAGGIQPERKYVRINEKFEVTEYNYSDKDLEKRFQTIYDDATKTRLYKSGWLTGGRTAGMYVEPVVTLREYILKKAVRFRND